MRLIHRDVVETAALAVVGTGRVQVEPPAISVEVEEALVPRFFVELAFAGASCDQITEVRELVLSCRRHLPAAGKIQLVFNGWGLEG